MCNYTCELVELLDELEWMDFHSIELTRHATFNPETFKYERTGKYQVEWGHNRISWVDLPRIIENTREKGLKTLIRKASKLLATDHQFGDGLRKG